MYSGSVSPTAKRRSKRLIHTLDKMRQKGGVGKQTIYQRRNAQLWGMHPNASADASV